MKYIVISDTHGFIENAEAVIESFKDEIDGIIHLGDVLRDVVSLKYKFPNLPIEFICGNNDINVTVPYEKTILINGRKILITHGHRQRVHMGLMNICYWALEKNADAVLFGHTHSFVCQNIDGIAVFNPGSISLPRSTSYPTFGIMEITDSGIMNFSVLKYEDKKIEF